MRAVICHYHIYKNSGTSFDKILTENYGEKHICFDGPFPFFTIDQEQLSRVVERKPEIIAFSSHQIQLPVPASLDFIVLPVVFVRHPLLRILSIYKFKNQTFDGTTTSKAAQEMSFDEWVSYCFSDRLEITHISNAQTRLLGGAYRQRPLVRRTSIGMEYDINQAMRNIENVELLARTEYFNDDIDKFSKILEKYNVDFNFYDIDPQNVTSNDLQVSIDERVLNIKNLLSQSNFDRLILANDQDLNLYEHATRLIEQNLPNSHYI